jgi:hypothetical protein
MVIASGPTLFCQGQSLCSAVTSVPGWNPYTCVVPATTFPVGVSFTVGQYHTQPYTTSPTQYTPLQVVTGSGQAWCEGLNYALLPPLGYTVNLTGTGSGASQVWQGTITDWGTLPFLPPPANLVPTYIDVQYTQQVTATAYWCCR